MQSGHVNASQLRGSFPGSENEKIDHDITEGDFAGELEKFIAAPATDAKVAGKSWRSFAAKPESANAHNPGLQASSAGVQGAQKIKTSQSSTIRERKNGTDFRTKTDTIKSEAKKEASLSITNPAIAESIPADLQYPAETGKTRKGVQNEEGSISVKDLKSPLYTQPTTGSENPAQVPAEHARALVESLVTRECGTKQQGLPSAGALQSSVRIKAEGSYTPGEFGGLLEKALQKADAAREQLTGSESLSGSAETAKTAAGVKTGRAERLAASVIPSFISADSKNTSTKKTFVSTAESASSEAQGASAGDVREHSIEAVSDNLKSDERPIAAKISMEARDREWAARGMEAGIKGGSGRAGSSPDTAAASPSVRQEAAQMPVESLDPILKNFDAMIVSAGPQQPEAEAGVTPASGGPHEGTVAQVQNQASQARGVEKQADRASWDDESFKAAAGRCRKV